MVEEKRECKIVQDLLPHYEEGLTSEQTNQYIKEHLEGCLECKKILENMKKKLEFNGEKRDGREVKYIKKYNKKMKVLRNILLVIIGLFIIIVGRKTIILTDLSNKAKAIKQEDNYYIKTESFSNGEMNIMESYCKDDRVFSTRTSYTKDGTVKMTFYKSGEEHITLVDNGSTKKMIQTLRITINPIFFTGDNLGQNIFLAITKNIDKVNLDGVECYIVKDKNTEKFIDVNTGLAIKMINNENNETVDYYYEFGIVKDEDIVRPDTTDYMEVDM